MAATDTYGDRYRIMEKIGDGGSSVVYRALDTRLGVNVALKVVHADPQRVATLRARLRTEAETMMRLSHPNILQVYAVGEDADWIAMDLSEQGSLADHVGEHGPLSPRQAIRVVLQLLAALKVAHDHGVVHRDVKPENLLLQPDGSIKLCDFGIALVKDETRVTRAGFAMGSLPYMAPEQRVDPGKVGTSADLYSAGATFYFLITGSTPVDLFLAPPSSPRFSGLPEGLVEIIRKATAADPAERYADADAMIDALTPCLELAANSPVERSTPAGPARVRTVTLPPVEEGDDVARLQAELHRQWRQEEEIRLRSAARNNKRLALLVGFSLILLVLGAGTVVGIEDWMETRQRHRSLADADITGMWTGTFGTHIATLELRGGPSAMIGALEIRNRQPRAVAGAITGGWLVLVDQEGQGLNGQYRASLVDGGRLDGEYVTSEGDWAFHFVRVD